MLHPNQVIVWGNISYTFHDVIKSKFCIAMIQFHFANYIIQSETSCKHCWTNDIDISGSVLERER